MGRGPAEGGGGAIWPYAENVCWPEGGPSNDVLCPVPVVLVACGVLPWLAPDCEYAVPGPGAAAAVDELSPGG